VRSESGARRVGAALAFACLFVLALPGAASAAGRCGQHPWCDTALSADQRAGLLLGALTRDEKISLLGGDDLFGVGGGAGSHTGTSNGVDRVGLPSTYYSDGPVGPRQGQATSMPASMALAATFDRGMAFRHGATVGNEVKLKGNDVVFAPTVNIMRTPLGGRTFEAYGEDPFVQSRMAVGWIDGAQSEGVIANVKHFAANNQEGQGVSTPGAPIGAGVQGSRLTVNAVVDERTLREVYLSQFEAAVKEANVGSVMCSYNRLNGQYACENKHLLTDVLKGEWGFKGYVLADYGAAKNTADSLRNGLDFDPWPGFAYSPTAVNTALAAGGAPESSVDVHVRLILRTLFAYGFFDRTAHPNDDNQIDKQGHGRTARQIEQSGIVLLKNDGLLPLDPARVKSIALIGSDADRFKSGGGSSNVQPFFSTTPRQGIERRAGSRVQVRYDPGDDADRAAALARSSDVAVVVAADTATEGSDKPCLTLECGSGDNLDRDALIQKVAAANKNTVVVLETSGPVLTPWRGSVAGLLEAWYPGEEGGSAIARVLFGDADPGGRLPATFPKREADESYAGDPEAYPGVGEQVVYKEGVFVGYRWFDQKRLEPAFPFGSGLSYTSFSYRDLRLAPARNGSARAAVEVDVKNTGRRTGTEVAQLYLGMPDPGPGVRQPPRVLRGFEKLSLKPGQTGTARFELTQRDFSYWDTKANAWKVAPGCYRVMVGHSSRDTKLQGTLSQGGASCPSVCASASGFRSVSARPTRRGVRLGFNRLAANPASVSVYQQARGRRVIRPRLLARFKRRTRSFAWPNPASRRKPRLRDGYLFVRFSVRGLSGRIDSRRVALRRIRGRFRRRPAFQRRESCGLLRSYRLSGPAFGGSTRRPLGIAYRLARAGRVSVVVLRGKRVAKRYRTRRRRAGRIYRLRVSSRRLRRGDYRVRLRAGRLRSTLTSRRL
jgi:beta-glucosidase